MLALKFLSSLSGPGLKADPTSDRSLWMSSAGSALLVCSAAGSCHSLGSLRLARLDSLLGCDPLTVGPTGVGPAGANPDCVLRGSARSAFCIYALGLVGGACPEETFPCDGTFPGLWRRFELLGGEHLVKSAVQQIATIQKSLESLVYPVVGI